MPKELDECVESFISNPFNKKKWPKVEERRTNAFPICRSRLKLQSTKEKDNEQLFTWHYWLHGYYHTGRPEGMSEQDNIDLHTETATEMIDRGMEHPHWDGLDEKSHQDLALPADLSDAELETRHDEAHRTWHKVEEKKDMFENEHWLIRLLMEKRGIEHPQLDELDAKEITLQPVDLGVVFALHMDKSITEDLDFKYLLEGIGQFIPERHIFVLTAMEGGILLPLSFYKQFEKFKKRPEEESTLRTALEEGIKRFDIKAAVASVSNDIQRSAVEGLVKEIFPKNKGDRFNVQFVEMKEYITNYFSGKMQRFQSIEIISDPDTIEPMIPGKPLIVFKDKKEVYSATVGGEQYQIPMKVFMALSDMETPKRMVVEGVLCPRGELYINDVIGWEGVGLTSKPLSEREKYLEKIDENEVVKRIKRKKFATPSPGKYLIRSYSDTYHLRPMEFNSPAPEKTKQKTVTLQARFVAGTAKFIKQEHLLYFEGLVFRSGTFTGMDGTTIHYPVEVVERGYSSLVGGRAKRSHNDEDFQVVGWVATVKFFKDDQGKVIAAGYIFDKKFIKEIQKKKSFGISCEVDTDAIEGAEYDTAVKASFSGFAFVENPACHDCSLTSYKLVKTGSVIDEKD